MDNYFAREAEIMDIAYDLDKDWILYYFYLIGTFTK